MRDDVPLGKPPIGYRLVTRSLSMCCHCDQQYVIAISNTQYIIYGDQLRSNKTVVPSVAIC